MSYKIIRMYQDDRPDQIVKRRLTLDQAQAHCNNPSTQKVGEWFDGFTSEKSLRRKKVSVPCPYVADCDGTASGVPDGDGEIMCGSCGSWVAV